ncbi:hypothetical protein HDU97_010093 [Phlyctochytrium planicorne]|nr:hypothetical protein HDU97_010093 [Phlyctochytrium planicorne]
MDASIDAAPSEGNGLQKVAEDVIVSLGETGTDAMVILSIMSDAMVSVENLGKEKLALISASMEQLVKKQGLRVFLRLFPDMNSKWDATKNLPQDPLAYIQLYRNVHNSITTTLSPYRDRFAFMWSPDCRVHRKFVSMPASTYPSLDTDGSGQIDKNDDPYTPYFPGESVVDWLGCEYYYASPTNTLPALAFGDLILAGNPSENGGRGWSVYRASTESTFGKKPFMVVGTGVGYNLSLEQNPTDRLAMKRAFWGSTVAEAPYSSLFEGIKGFCVTEKVVEKDGHLIDFTNAGLPNGQPWKDWVIDNTRQYVLSLAGNSDDKRFANDTASGRPASGPRIPQPEKFHFDFEKLVLPALLLISMATVIFVWRQMRKRELRSMGILPNQKASRSTGSKLKSISDNITTFFAASSAPGYPSFPTSPDFDNADVDIGSKPVYPSFPMKPDLGIANASSKPTYPSFPMKRNYNVTSEQASSTSAASLAEPGTNPIDIELTTAELTASIRQAPSSSQPTPQNPTKSFLFPPSVADPKSTLFNTPQHTITDADKSTTHPDESSSQSDSTSHPAKPIPAPPPSLTQVSQWTTDQVKTWLLEAGVSENIVDIMTENNVDGYRLLLISDRMLMEIGIGSATARNLMLYAVARLREGGGGEGGSLETAVEVGRLAATAQSCPKTRSSKSKRKPVLEEDTIVSDARELVDATFPRQLVPAGKLAMV